jgi:hypothetical protein
MARFFTYSSLALLLTLAACGSNKTGTATTVTPDPTPSETATPPTASAPSAPTPPPDAPTATPTGTPSGSGEDQPGGGGDEAAARVPVAITVGSDGTVSPASVSVPAFLALELQVRNRTGGSITVRWEASEPAGTFEVGAGKTGSRRVAGVKPGRYPLAIGGAGSATVVAGTEPGP